MQAHSLLTLVEREEGREGRLHLRLLRSLAGACCGAAWVFGVLLPATHIECVCALMLPTSASSVSSVLHADQSAEFEIDIRVGIDLYDAWDVDA